MIPIVCSRCMLQSGTRDVILPTDDVQAALGPNGESLQIIYEVHRTVEDCLVGLRIQGAKMKEEAMRAIAVYQEITNRHNEIVESEKAGKHGDGNDDATPE